MVSKEDMKLLIEVEDELSRMDKVLEQLAGLGHASGVFIKLDNVYDVILHNSHPYYSNSEETELELFKILINQEKTPAERAEILLNEPRIK